MFRREQILYTIRSERRLMEQLDYNLLFRWFVGLNMDDAVWDATVYSKNRDRMLKAGIAGLFFQAVVEEAREVGLLSDEHFSVDGTLIEAWAIQKSFQRKDSNGKPGDSGNSSVDFHGEQRTNQTHESKTDPDARLYKKGKGKEAKLCYAGHALWRIGMGWPWIERSPRAQARQNAKRHWICWGTCLAANE